MVKKDFENLMRRMEKLNIFDFQDRNERLAFAFIMQENYDVDKEGHANLVHRTMQAIDAWLELDEDDAQMLTYFGCAMLVAWLEKLDKFPTIVREGHDGAYAVRIQLDEIASMLIETAINDKKRNKIIFGVVPEKYAPVWFDQNM